jgi:hypothetical protein
MINWFKWLLNKSIIDSSHIEMQYIPSELSSYINNLYGGWDINNPILLSIEIDLGKMYQAGSNWKKLLDIINKSGKYVNLDLSLCTLNEMEDYNGDFAFDPDYSFSDGKNKIVSIILPDVTQSIYSFNNFTILSSVSLPSDVSINFNPFSNCNELINFTLTGTGNLSVIEGGKALIKNDTELLAYPSASGSITINSITIIGGGAFSGCVNLTSVSFPNVIKIENSSFWDCTNLANIYFPNVKSIGDYAFANCTSLVSVSFPALENIYNDCTFSGCTNLVSISFPASTTFLSSGGSQGGPFSLCNNLTSFFLIGEGHLSTFENGKALVRNLSNDGIELIAYPSASGSIVLNNITSIATRVFESNTKITSVSIPNVTSFTGYYQFLGCTNLSSVSLGNIPDMLSSTFRGNLVDVYFSVGGGEGTYVTINPDSYNAIWVKQ